MNMIKKALLTFGSMLMLAGCGGVNNNISFSVSPGSCADGTNNAPYCAAVTIQNNAGGQNYITSTNFPIQNLTFSATGPSNVNYPIGTGSSMDPNGCLNSTVAPGGTCTFYLQLTGESAPVGPKVPVTITANYTINNTLFGGSNTTASSSFTVYEYPAVVVSSTSGMAQNYSNNTINPIYNTESGGNAQVLANANDNYYGFLYLITNSGNIMTSGTESFSYNITESSLSSQPVNNIVISGTTAYPITGFGNIYSSSIRPVSSINWGSIYNPVSSLSLSPNLLAFGVNYLYVVSNANQVYACVLNSSSGSQNSCNAEGVSSSSMSLGAIQSVGYSPLGTNLTGLVAGTVTGLFVESGMSNSPSNQWESVTVNGIPLTGKSIVKIVSDNSQDLYIADGSNNIYIMTPGSGSTATLLTNLSGSSAISAMVYDNAGNKLYVGTPNTLYSCAFESSTFSCGSVTSTSISNVLGMNIITSLLAN